MIDDALVYKTIKDQLVVYLNIKGKFEDIPDKMEILTKKFKNKICGPAIIEYDYGVYSETYTDITIAFPVDEEVEINDIEIKVLKGAEVMSIIHKGPYDNLRESYGKLYGFLREKALEPTSFGREIYLKTDRDNPENNITEIQAILHKWDDRFASNVERVLGSDAKKVLMKNSQILFTIESTNEQRVKWLKLALTKLSELADEQQTYDILSCCAHEFSDKRISFMRAIYEEMGIDAVLEEMKKDYDWYEDPIIKENKIYVTKIPYNRKGLDEAKTREEKRKNYCHCSMVRNFLDSDIPRSFCYCSSGWYRRLWEGILGQQVQIEIVKTLITGAEQCDFIIHLPEGFKI